MREAGPRQQVRQLHAAILEAALGVVEAGLDEGIHRRFDLGNQHRLAVLVERFMLVGRAVVRGEVLLRDLAGGTQGRIEGFAAVIGEARAAGQRLGVEHFVEFEGEIAWAKQRFGHEWSLRFYRSSLRSAARE